jgi:hypothetical protein
MMSSTVARIVLSHRLATSCPCVVRHHAVERPGTVVALRSPDNMSCWHLMRRPQHAPQANMTPSSCTSGRYLGNTLLHLGNVRGLLYLLLMAHRRSRYTSFSRAHVHRETGFGAPCYVVAPELTCWAQSCGTHDGSGAPPPPQSREVGVKSCRAYDST